MLVRSAWFSKGNSPVKNFESNWLQSMGQPCFIAVLGLCLVIALSCHLASGRQMKVLVHQLGMWKASSAGNFGRKCVNSTNKYEINPKHAKRVPRKNGKKHHRKPILASTVTAITMMTRSVGGNTFFLFWPSLPQATHCMFMVLRQWVTNWVGNFRHGVIEYLCVWCPECMSEIAWTRNFATYGNQVRTAEHYKKLPQIKNQDLKMSLDRRESGFRKCIL